MQKNLRGKGNACIKAELGDKSKCDNCFGSEHWPLQFVGASTKRHLYWSMRNSSGNLEELRNSILNISQHYQVCCWLLMSLCFVEQCYCQQGNHTKCHKDSLCHSATYSPRRIVLRDSQAIEVYENVLRSTTIFKYAESYCRVSYIHSSDLVTCISVPYF